MYNKSVAVSYVVPLAIITLPAADMLPAVSILPNEPVEVEEPLISPIISDLIYHQHLYFQILKFYLIR